MDENLMNLVTEDDLESEEITEYLVSIEEPSQSVSTTETMDVVEVEDVEPLEIVVEESVGWVGGDNTRHYSLYGRDEPNQHPIESITGLRTELNEIERLKVVYSDKANIGNYYEWDGASYDEYGYFVSMVPEKSKIKICSGSNIFGVSVDEAGFIGGQDEDVPRDNSYGLIVTSGIVDVRCELDVKPGDYVTCNTRGWAEKSDSNYGYKVLAVENKRNVQYAVISLGVQADVTDALGVEVGAIESRVSANEKNITSAINVANQAYNKAESAAGSASISEETVKEALEEILGIKGTVGEVNEALVSASLTATQARAIAESAVTSANSFRDDAINEANKAMKETAELRKDFEATAEAMNIGLNDAVDDLKTLKEDLRPLAVWPEGSDIESTTGYAGFVAQANEDSAILGMMVGRKGEDGETLAGFIQEAEDTRATVRGIVGYEYTDKNGKPVTGAAGLMAQVDDTKSEVSAVANRSFTKKDGTVVTGLAGLDAQVDENESNVALVANRVAGKYTVIPELVNEDKRDISKIYGEYDANTELVTYWYYNDGEWSGAASWDTLDVKQRGRIYYVAVSQKYWYWHYENNIWKSTDDAYEAGLPAAISGVQVETDDNSASINSLTAWQGETSIAMARIEQKADANGAYIQSTVANLSKYSVGPHSQAHNFTLAQMRDVFEGEIIYASTELHDEEYRYTIEPVEVESWDETGKDICKVYYANDDKNYYYYYQEEWTYEANIDEIPTYRRTFTPGYLYKWGRLTEFPYGWITIDKDYVECDEVNADNTNAANNSSMAVYFSSTEIAMGSDNKYGYWYTNGDTIIDAEGATGVYEPYTLYKWDSYINADDEVKYHWVVVATLAGNSSSRAVSLIRQDSNSVVAAIADTCGSVAGLGAWLSDTESKLQTTTSWAKGKDESGNDLYNLATIDQSANGDGSRLALVVADRNGNTTLNGASIVLNQGGGSSYIQMDADKINFTANDYSVLSKNITLKGDQIEFATGDFGGRNLIGNSLIEEGTNEYGTIKRYVITKLEPNKKYTFSVNGRNDTGSNDHYLLVQLHNKTWDGVLKTQQIEITEDVDTTKSVTFTTPNGVGNIDIAATVYYAPKTNSPSGKVRINWMKLEEGSIPTDWTPAPEDNVPAEHTPITGMKWRMLSDKCVWWNSVTTESAPLMRLDQDGLYIKGNGEFTGDIIANSLTLGAGTIGTNSTGISISKTGLLKASNAIIYGTVTASSGSIAAWNVGRIPNPNIGTETSPDYFWGGTIINYPDSLYIMSASGSDSAINNDSALKSLTSDSYLTFLRHPKNDGSHIMAIRHRPYNTTTSAFEPVKTVFAISKNGSLYATKGTIGGVSIGSGVYYSDYISRRLTLNVSGGASSGEYQVEGYVRNIRTGTERESSALSAWFEPENNRICYSAFSSLVGTSGQEEMYIDYEVSTTSANATGIGNNSCMLGVIENSNQSVLITDRIVSPRGLVIEGDASCDSIGSGANKIRFLTSSSLEINLTLEIDEDEGGVRRNISLIATSRMPETRMFQLKVRELPSGNVKYIYITINEGEDRGQYNGYYEYDYVYFADSLRTTKTLRYTYSGMEISGKVIPADTNATIGTSSAQWSHIYADNINGQTTTPSDRNLKNTIQDIALEYGVIFDSLRPVTFKYNDCTSGRTHIGLIAQEVEKAANDAGISTDDFAPICVDNGQYGLRYGEFIALCVSEIQKLKTRVTELESQTALN